MSKPRKGLPIPAINLAISRAPLLAAAADDYRRGCYPYDRPIALKSGTFS